MPTKKAIVKRGGVVRIRTKKIPGSTKLIRIYVVRKPGKRGGRTLAGEVFKPKPKKKGH